MDRRAWMKLHRRNRNITMEGWEKKGIMKRQIIELTMILEIASLA